jgi:hypothetical protein
MIGAKQLRESRDQQRVCPKKSARIAAGASLVLGV